MFLRVWVPTWDEYQVDGVKGQDVCGKGVEVGVDVESSNHDDLDRL